MKPTVERFDAYLARLGIAPSYRAPWWGSHGVHVWDVLQDMYCKGATVEERSVVREAWSDWEEETLEARVEAARRERGAR